MRDCINHLFLHNKDRPRKGGHDKEAEGELINNKLRRIYINIQIE